MTSDDATGDTVRAFVCPGCGNTLTNPPTLPIKCECGCRVRAADWDADQEVEDHD